MYFKSYIMIIITTGLGNIVYTVGLRTIFRIKRFCKRCMTLEDVVKYFNGQNGWERLGGCIFTLKM